MPCRASLCDGRPLIGLPSNTILPWLGVDEAHDGLERGALADAVAAEQADHLSRPDLQRDAVQDVALAVEGVDVLDRDQRLLGEVARGSCLEIDLLHPRVLLDLGRRCPRPAPRRNAAR